MCTQDNEIGTQYRRSGSVTLKLKGVKPDNARRTVNSPKRPSIIDIVTRSTYVKPTINETHPAKTAKTTPRLNEQTTFPYKSIPRERPDRESQRPPAATISMNLTIRISKSSTCRSTLSRKRMQTHEAFR